MKSTVITDEDELTPEERLDMAAARSPATTSPLSPAGRPTAMNWGNSRSASPRIVCPSPTRCGLRRKNAKSEKPTHVNRRLTTTLAPSVVISTWRAALASRVAR